MREDETIYVVTAGYYEDKRNVLVTDSIDKAVTKLLNVSEGVSIQIWKNEMEIHEYGVYKYEEIDDYAKIYSNIKYIERYGVEEYRSSSKSSG